MSETRIPAFAILGHPNEGKSSVVSTLAEDDSVRISPIPGETKKCREYPVSVDGHEVIRFIDTPGFQRPRQTLNWVKNYSGPDHQLAADFIAAHGSDRRFADECELLSPLAEGSGIIYVVDGSRPVRNIDQIEMEILRLTGLPRMAIINTKEKNRTDFLDDWKSNARKHFNTIRLFDAHRATYGERIDLLESLKGIDPDWQPALSEVITAFKKDWQQRLYDTVTIIIDLIEIVLRYDVKKTLKDESQIVSVKETLQKEYQEEISRLEARAHKKIKRRYKHNIFNYELPSHSIIKENLFSKKSWRVLGLNQWQLAAAGGAGGGVIGAKIDLALAGHSLGLFTAIGGLVGAGSTAFGAKQATGAKIKGLPLGRTKIQVGPMTGDQFPYIVIDRALIYFSHAINWAHSRRHQPAPGQSETTKEESGFTTKWTSSQKQQANRFFKAIRKGDLVKAETLKPQVINIISDTLKEITLF